MRKRTQTSTTYDMYEQLSLTLPGQLHLNQPTLAESVSDW